MTNYKMDMIASIADCYSKGTLGVEDAYLLTVRVIEGSLSVTELLHILAKMECKPNVGHHYDCNHDCDALNEAYHKEFLEGYKGYKERKEKEAEKINKKKVIDEMNEAMYNEFKNCFGGIE